MGYRLITSGTGLIGSHLVELFVNKSPQRTIINLDKSYQTDNLINSKGIEVNNQG